MKTARSAWIPAFAGMTEENGQQVRFDSFLASSAQRDEAIP
jgi:hypothetical protein